MHMKKTTTWTIIVIVILVVLGIALLSTPKQKAPEEAVTPEAEGVEGVLPKEEAPAKDVEKEAAAEKEELLDSPLGLFNSKRPKQTEPLDEETLPEGVVRIRVSRNQGFGPDIISHIGGRVHSWVLLGSPGESHSLVFEDSVLSNVVIRIGRGENRGVSFVTPEKSGDYTFYCDEPGHREAGETGILRVL